eukprot:4315797-Amphidinium_carterae.1
MHRPTGQKRDEKLSHIEVTTPTYGKLYLIQMKCHPSLWVLVDRYAQQRKGVFSEAGQWTDEQGTFRQLDSWFEASSIKPILGIYVDDFVGFACCQEVNDRLMKR